MNYFEMPDGWKLITHAHTTDGCLRILITHDDAIAYTVTWHKDDRITMVALDLAGHQMLFNPAAIVVAMAVIIDKGLSPRYHSDTGRWN